MKTRRVHVPEIVATASFVLLVAAALTGFSTWFAAALLAGIVLPVALFRRLFPQAGLFALALANLLSVYACLYVYFVEANFVPVGPWAEATAFLLPIIAFVAGCLTKQNHIRHLAERRPRLRRQDLMETLGCCRSSSSASSPTRFPTWFRKAGAISCCCYRWPQYQD